MAWWNYFTSSNPRHGISKHIWLLTKNSDIYFDLLLGIYSDILSRILSGVSSLRSGGEHSDPPEFAGKSGRERSDPGLAALGPARGTLRSRACS